MHYINARISAFRSKQPKHSSHLWETRPAKAHTLSVRVTPLTAPSCHTTAWFAPRVLTGSQLLLCSPWRHRAAGHSTEWLHDCRTTICCLFSPPNSTSLILPPLWVTMNAHKMVKGIFSKESINFSCIYCVTDDTYWGWSPFWCILHNLLEELSLKESNSFILFFI